MEGSGEPGGCHEEPKRADPGGPGVPPRGAVPGGRHRRGTGLGGVRGRALFPDSPGRAPSRPSRALSPHAPPASSHLQRALKFGIHPNTHGLLRPGGRPRGGRGGLRAHPSTPAPGDPGARWKTPVVRQPGKGGDPLIMRTSMLRAYLEPLLDDPTLEHIQSIRIGSRGGPTYPVPDFRYSQDSPPPDTPDMPGTPGNRDTLGRPGPHPGGIRCIAGGKRPTHDWGERACPPIPESPPWPPVDPS